MPLRVTNFSWTQTDSMVYVTVPLKGARVGSVDIISTDEYLKVHYPPNLFEAFLFEPVNCAKSTVQFGNGAAVICLPKRTNKVWEHLMISANDEEKKETRQRALMKYQEKLCVESISKAEKKHKENKYALETMLKIEKEEQDIIQKLKNNEKENHTAKLTAWQVRQKEESQLKFSGERDNKKDLSGMIEKQETRPSGDGDVKQELKDKCAQKSKKNHLDLPDPRPTGTIQVSFTSRVFPTALRESRMPEEEEWLNREAEARRAVKADIEDLKELTEAEKYNGCFKDKGDKCYAAGDYLGAVNSYSLAIRLNRKIPALYSNRAACHLKLRNFHKAIDDSSQALDLLTPPVHTNAAARVKAHVRRGSALCHLQLYAEGLEDYQKALQIDRYNEALQADTQRIRNIIQNTAATQKMDQT